MLAAKFDTTPQRLERFWAFLRDERASTATEYALIEAGISVVISAVVVAIGVSLREDYYEPIADGISRK